MGKYFTIDELINSNVAKKHNISNIPNKQQLDNLNKLVTNILDPLREAYGKPIIVTSGFRSEELNDLLNGAKGSQHCSGNAADIRTVPDTMSENKILFELIQELNLPFDQLINEDAFNWVHVSYSDRHRKQILHI